jgi:hypothetical protein
MNLRNVILKATVALAIGLSLTGLGAFLLLRQAQKHAEKSCLQSLAYELKKSPTLFSHSPAPPQTNIWFQLSEQETVALLRSLLDKRKIDCKYLVRAQRSNQLGSAIRIQLRYATDSEINIRVTGSGHDRKFNTPDDYVLED